MRPAPLNQPDGRLAQGRASRSEPQRDLQHSVGPHSRKPDPKAVKKVLSEEPIPLQIVHGSAAYHKIPKTKTEGWPTS